MIKIGKGINERNLSKLKYTSRKWLIKDLLRTFRKSISLEFEALCQYIPVKQTIQKTTLMDTNKEKDRIITKLSSWVGG